MADDAARDALFDALETDRGDTFALAALADWFEERDDAVASACLRWAGRAGRRPGFNAWQFTFGRFFWERQDGRPIIDDPPAQLPAPLWDALTEHDEGRPVISFKSYKTARLAYLALVAAWRETDGGLREKIHDN